jgi:hypothetical protein
VLSALRRGRRQAHLKDLVSQRTIEDQRIIERCISEPWNASEAPAGRLSKLLKKVRTVFRPQQPKVAETLPLRPIGLLVSQDETVKVMPITLNVALPFICVASSKEMTRAAAKRPATTLRPVHVRQPVSMFRVEKAQQEQARPGRARQPPMRRIAGRSPLAQEVCCQELA